MSERQVAFVSGAARGIGKAIALKLARDGFNVAVNDVGSNISALEGTAAEIRALGTDTREEPTYANNISNSTRRSRKLCCNSRCFKKGRDCSGL